MIVNGVSNLATNLMVQQSLTSTQNQLNEAQNELSTGRYSDVGLTLGGNVSRNLDWRVTLSNTTSFLDTNAQALAKADALQSSLETAKATASDFLSTLVASRNSQNGQILTQQGASNALSSVVSAVNTNYAGQYIMGGQNTDQPPLTDYTGGAAQTAFDAAFQSYFGFAKTSSSAQSITPAQMTSFLQGPYDNLFQPSSWNGTFSNASSAALKTSISTNQQVDLSANANEGPIKDLMKGLVAAQDAGTGQLNASAFQTVVDYALGKLGNAVQGIGETEARVGDAQQTVTQTNTKLTSMKLVVEGQIQKSEGVNNAEVATRVNNLMNQMEANYAVTGKLAKLSLLSYI